MGNPLYTYSRCVSWLREHAVSGMMPQVWWLPCALWETRGHWFNVSSGHISLARCTPKVILPLGGEFILKWLAV